MKKSKYFKITSVILTIGLFGFSSCRRADVKKAEIKKTEQESAKVENIIPNPNFDAGIDKYAMYKEGGTADLKWNAEKKCLECDIQSVGTKSHAVQAYVDGFALDKGVVYGFSFDASSTLERSIDWRFQINGGDYHAYKDGKAILNENPQTFKSEFTMNEENDPAPRLCFNIGYVDEYAEAKIPSSSIESHKIFIDNLKLVILDDSNAAGATVEMEIPNIRVNQLGYFTSAKKTAVICDLKDEEKYSIKDVDSGKVVKTGSVPKLTFSEFSGEKNAIIDFSDLTTNGKYKFETESGKESFEFAINNDIYSDSYEKLVKMLYLQRCGMELSTTDAGRFAHPICHTQKATIFGTDKKIDVSGGWHDAGDYGRYVVSGVKAVADLFIAYDSTKKQKLLDEAKYELDWLFKMQNSENGGVYHKVTGELFPGTIMPQDETWEMIVSPISNCATGDFAAIMAIASRLYANDAEYSKKCLSVAQKAYDYLVAHKNDAGFKNPGNVVTGEYSDEVCSDEIFWAAVELYNITNDEKYFDGIKEAFAKVDSLTELGWVNMAGYGVYSAFVNENLKNNHADFVEEIKNKFISQIDSMIKTAKNNSYKIARSTEFEWGSNMGIANSGMLFVMASKISNKTEYKDFALNALNYLYGVNATGYCFITKTGTFSPKHTHHRPSQKLGEVMEGMLVGGVNSGLNDPYAKAVLEGKPVAKCYVDNEQSYSCNEICVYWNSPLIALIDMMR